MSEAASRATARRFRGLALAIVGYFLAHELSFNFPGADRILMAIWPPAGVGLAAFLLLPRKDWKYLALALYATGTLADLLQGRPVLASLGFMAANMLESWLCALVILRKRHEGPLFSRTADMLALIFASTLVNGLTASFGALIAILAGGGSFGAAWFSWWISDGLGLLIVTPLVLAWKDFAKLETYPRGKRIPEGLVFFAIWIATCWLSFNGSFLAALQPLPYVLALLVIWPALRFSMRSLSLALVLLFFIAILSRAVLVGPSPMHGTDAVQRLLFMESFLAVLTMTAYILAAAFSEHRIERVRAEESLANLRAVGDSIPSGFVFQLLMSKDGSRRFTYVSSGLSELGGIEPAEVLSDAQALYNRVHPEDRQRLQAEEAQALATLSVFQTTLRFQHRDGTWHWVHISSTPRLLDEGSVLWNGVQTDVTAQRIAEDELREKEARHRAILERASDGIFIFDSTGRYYEANEAYCQLLGYAKEEMIELGWHRVVDMSDAERNPTPFKELAAGQARTWERRMIRKDGSRRDFEISGKAFGEDRFLGIARDITERKWNERVTQFRLRIAESMASTPLEEILKVILDEGESATGSRIGFFHFIDDAEENITLQVWSANTIATMCSVPGTPSHYPILQAGVWCDAVRERRVIIHNDYATLPGRKGLPAGHAPILRELLSPVIRGGRVVALFGVGNKESNYDDHDVALLGDLGELTWDIVERKRSEERLIETEERFIAVFRGSPLSTTLTRMSTGLIVDANVAAERVFGYSREELIGATTTELGIFEDAEARKELLARVGEKEGSSWEMKLRRKGGEVFNAAISVEIVHFAGESYLVTQILDVTERSRAEQALRASEAKYRAILEHAGDGIFITDAQGRYIEVNEAGCNLVGYPKDEILGMSVAEIVEPAELSRHPVAYDELRTGKPVRTQRRLRRRDGKIVEVEISAKALEDGRMIGIVRDIGDRNWSERVTSLRLKLTEAAAADSLDLLLQAILDEAEIATGSSIGFYHFLDEDQVTLTLQNWSTNTLATMCSAEGKGQHYPLYQAGVWGDAVRLRQPVVHNDYPSMPGRKGLPEGHAAIFRELVVPVLRKGLVVAILGVGNKGEGYDAGDMEKLSHLAEISWDIVERKRTQELLAETEERLASIFRGSPLPSALTRIETGVVIDANEAFIALFEHPRELVIGSSVFELGIYAEPKDREELVRLVGASAGAISIECRLTKRGGRHFEALMSVEIVHIKGEHFLVSQIQDITERRRAEEDLRRALAEKEVLLRELYHRSNNNMQVISALLEFQAESIRDDRLSRAISETQDRIGSMALVNRKLYEAQDLSHINLREYIVELVRILSQSHKDGDGRITLAEDMEDVFVLVDTAIPCGLILNELVSNIFKHAYPKDRNGTIDVMLRKGEDGVIHLRIADHGVGVPAGFDFARDGRVGLQNIVGLCANQLRGQVLFDSTAGLACEISFADNIYEARV